MARRTEIVTVVNRTSAPIQYMYDAAEHILQPGENAIPVQHVRFARTQNIVMGSENPLNPAQYVSLIGVKAAPGKKQIDDITKIEFVVDDKRRIHAMFEDGTTMPVGIERIDRSRLGQELQNVVIERNRIPLRSFEVERTSLHDSAAGAIGG
jgi:hypothetical protein